MVGYGTIYETRLRFFTKTEISVAITGLFTSTIIQMGLFLILAMWMLIDIGLIPRREGEILYG